MQKQNEFYIGQKVRTSEFGKLGCTDMEGVIIADRIGKMYEDCFDVEFIEEGSNLRTFSIFKPEEIEPIPSTIPEIVFSNICNSLE